MAVPFGERLDLVSASQTAGPIFGAAFLSGVMELDAEKNAEIYGDATPADILNTLGAPGRVPTDLRRNEPHRQPRRAAVLRVPGSLPASSASPPDATRTASSSWSDGSTVT